MKNKDKVFKFLQDNYGWIVAVTTGLAIITTFVLKFVKYIYSSFYFNYYGLSYELFNNNELDFLYNFCFSILMLLCFCSLIYCYIQLFNLKKKKIKIKTILFNIILIIISNIFVVALVNIKCSLWQFILNVILLIIIEIVISFFFFKMDKKERNQKYEINDLTTILKILPFYLLLLIFLFLISYGSKVMTNKVYRIIDGNKVIIYTTTDYYLTLDCELKNNKLTIYKGKQTKINNTNVKSELIDFKKVKLN